MIGVGEIDEDVLEVGLRESVNCHSTRVDRCDDERVALAVTVCSNYDEVNLFFLLERSRAV